MRLAEHLHYAGSLKSLMRRIPRREFRMWMERLDELWNIPDRHDWYLMALRRTVISLANDNPPDLDEMKVKFGNRSERTDPTVKSKDYVKQRMEEAQASAGVIVRGKRPGE